MAKFLPNTVLAMAQGTFVAGVPCEIPDEIAAALVEAGAGMIVEAEVTSEEQGANVLPPEANAMAEQPRRRT